MEFSLLGPLLVRDDEGREVTPPSRKQRAALTALLLASGEVVSRERLFDALWPEGPPPTAATALQGHVSQLRKVIGAERLVTKAPGYRLRVSDGEVDLRRFEAALAAARETDDPATRAGHLRSALSLWRGSPLAEFDADPLVRPALERLAELRLTAVEERIEAELELGQAPELVPELESLVGADPYRERLRGLLMRALYLTGRQADALSVYRRGRELLVGELGIEPSPELQRLERRILMHDAALAPEVRDESLPRGTVTFVFTDVEGSTRRLNDVGADSYATELAEYRRIVRESFAVHGGVEVDTQGDGFFYAFERATDALAAAQQAQDTMSHGPTRVRIGVHTGEPLLTDVGYVGVDVHRAARIAAAGHGGQILVSQATRDLVDGVPLRDLGAHRLKDIVAPEWLFQLGEEVFPPLASVDAWPNNLPLQLTSFVGRERELARVGDLLDETRLLTVTGAGGTGKTRLAVEAGAGLLKRFPHGVWFVDLAPVAQGELVPQTLAAALALREEPGRPILNVLLGAIGQKRMLVILDNCEHVIDACASLADTLLRSCGEVRVLTTSRAPLSVAGETTLRLPPLETPDAASLPSFDQAIRYESVRLFIERGRAADPDFAISSENATAVAQICQRLDGIPLAIELAAARLRQLAANQIAERLDDRFGLLTKGSRTALPRHRTLRGLVDWSYELLDDEERALFRRVSVFNGGWTLEAAEQVCSAEPVSRQDVLGLLGRLIDSSLVVADEQPGGTMRFRLLETLRDYALERLREAGESDLIEAAHRRYFVELAELLDLQLLSSEQLSAFEQMEQEHDNFRSILAADPAVAGPELVRLAAALVVFWNFRNYWTEGLSWLEHVLRENDREPSLASAKALAMNGFFLAVLGDPAAAETLFARAEAEADELGTPLALTSVFGLLASARFALGHDDDSLVERYCDAAAETGWDWAIAFGEILRIWPSVSVDPERAVAVLEPLFERARVIGERLLIGFCVLGLGIAATVVGDHDLAVARLNEAVGLYRKVGHRGQFVVALGSLGQALLDRGDVPAAAAAFAEGLGEAVVSGTDPHLPLNLGGLACVASALGSDEQSARLLGAVDAIRAAGAIEASPLERTLEQRAVVRGGDRLGSDKFEALRRSGAQLELNQAVSLARTVADSAVEARPARVAQTR